ncbi:IS30 family transposase [Streptomyces murinus]|uniref:IS30 family transposase n=1 Tax=Streptomyces murinus TaxID=33900 RepID=UPI003F45B96E
MTQSITMDRGKEFALFEEIEDELNCSIYFSDLGCPYQRGSIENANGLLRQYYPKGTHFANITQKSLIYELLNKLMRTASLNDI